MELVHNGSSCNYVHICKSVAKQLAEAKQVGSRQTHKLITETQVVMGEFYNCFSFVGDCRHIRYIKFYPPQIGHYLEGHVFLNLSIGVHRQCEEECLMQSECVSVNIGPPINDKVVCELSDSDHMQHPEDLKSRYGWIYRGTEVRNTNRK